MSAELFHVGLTVVDVDRSVRFYRDVVGMDLLTVVDVDSEAFGHLTHNPGARLRTALLGSGGFQLQLVEYTAGGGSPLDLDHRHPGAPHLSFWVADVDALFGRLHRQEGVSVTSERVEVVPGIRSFYVADPDGVPVEFIERTGTDTETRKAPDSIERFEPLQTNRLHLEPVTQELARSIARGDVSGLEAADGWPQPGTVNGVTLAIEHGHPAGWLVISAGRVIGDCGIRAPADDAGYVEIGYGLAEPSRGHGFGTEVVTAISDWLLEQPVITKVQARTEPSNMGSRRVLEKAGFALVATTEDEVLYERHASRLPNV